MATVLKIPRQLAPTVGQRAAAIGVKFRPGSPSTLGRKVASGLVWRFGTFYCVSDNLVCFKDGFGDSGSFLDVGGHRFYIAKPFLEEVTDMLDPLCDAGSSCSESSDLGAMVEVLALEGEGGGGPSRTARSPLERPPLPKQDPPPPEWDILECAIMDLHAPLDLTAGPAKIAEDLEQARLALLDKAVGIEDTRTARDLHAPRVQHRARLHAGWRWPQPGRTSTSARPRSGHGAEPSGALSEVTSSHRQAYL
jgi:hypothetical protein